MSTHLPPDPHDFALWLFDNLEHLSCVGNTTLWEGRLPDDIDFTVVESHLESLTGSLAGPCRVDTREIGFYPSNVHVYENVHQLLNHAGNRTRVPGRFTIRDIGFSYPLVDDAAPPPRLITQYIDAVRLFSVLSNLADVRNGGLLFVSSHDAQLTVLPDFGPADLRALTPFPRFWRSSRVMSSILIRSDQLFGLF